MKIITVNLWGGKVYKDLLKFLEKQSNSVDIFCFQEMFFGHKPAFGIQGTRTNLFTEISKILNDFDGYTRFAPKGTYFQNEKLDPDLRVGQAIFVRKNIEVISSGGFFTYLPKSKIAKNLKITMSGNFQYIKVKNKNKEVLIGNLHGIWDKSGKLDTPERLIQSKILNEFLKKQNCSKIILGDFNILPSIKSMEILEENMINLVKKYKIISTRSKLNTNGIAYSDYILISPELEVKLFKVIDVVVSDHLPLKLVVGASLELTTSFTSRKRSTN
jgi:exonuclease III